MRIFMWDGSRHETAHAFLIPFPLQRIIDKPHLTAA